MIPLSIIVPFHNEEATVASVMERLNAAVPDAQVIYVDDGSTDASLSLVKSHVREEDVIRTKRNGGKGSAIREGLAHALGTYTIIQDADLEYDPKDIPSLLRAALEHHCDMVLGSRRMGPNRNDYAALRYYVGGMISNTLYNLLYLRRFSDIHSCYKLVKTDFLRSLPLREDGFGFDTELLSHCMRRGITIVERGISYRPRSRREGKKIGVKDFLRSLWVMLRVRFASDGMHSRLPRERNSRRESARGSAGWRS